MSGYRRDNSERDSGKKAGTLVALGPKLVLRVGRHESDMDAIG